jgi:transglutaminase-like putative cysteine protease
LPLPWLYAPQTIAGRFERRSQRWIAESLDPAFRAPVAKRREQVALRGRLPSGESVLPLPLYARVVDFDAQPAARLIERRDGLAMVATSEATEVRLRVALDGVPAFDAEGAEHEPPGRLVEHTVPDDDLPAEVHRFLGGLEGSAFERALSVRDFVRERYRYDPSYMEDHDVARWLRGVTEGRANQHIAALHAGRDAKHLGRGVCYELNVLACEMLRRADVPAAIATGWTYDRGSLAEPDHLWALALLPTRIGPRWFPIDASTTREGRPLHVGRRPAGPWRAKPPPRRRWAESVGASWAREERARTQTVQRKKKRKQQRRPPVDALLRVARHLEKLTGERIDAADVRARCEDLLTDVELANRLLALLEDDGES